MVKHLQKLFALVLVCCAFLGSSSEAWGQTNPTPQTLPYSMDFSGLAHSATAYPSGWQGWTLSTSPGSAFVMTAPTADRNLTASSTANTTSGNAHNYNGKIGFLNTSSLDIGLVLALNTIDKDNIQVVYDIMTIRNPYNGGSNTRINEVILQYRIGTSGDFKNVDNTEYRNNTVEQVTAITTPQNVVKIAATLPEETWNQPVVQVRWASRQVSGGGSRPSFAVDNVVAQRDGIAPTILSLNPSNGAMNVKTTTNSISVTFNENIAKGTGTITLVDAGNSANNQVIDVTSPDVKINGATVSIPVTLAPNKIYYVQVSETAITDKAGNAFAGISNNTTWAFTTPEFATPVLSVNKTTVNLAYVKEGAPTLPTTYTLSGVDVREPVTVTAASPFEVSLDGITFASSVSVPASSVLSGATIYVNLTATTIGDYSGTITNIVPEGDNVLVTAVGGIYNQYAQNFNNCAPAFSKTLTGGWKQISIAGDVTWACTNFGRPDPVTTTSTSGVEINGYNSSTGMGAVNEDWLISPSFDLTTVSIPVLSFWSKSSFAGPALKVMISTDYDGSSAPATATWTELNVLLPEVGSEVWTKSEALLDLFKQPSVHVAFVYTSVAEINGSSRWTIDDFLITDEPRKLVATNATYDFGAIAAGNFTEAQYVTFKALGFTEDIVISSDLVDFEVSKDNITFTQSVTYTAAEAAEGEELFIRFLPKSNALRFKGTISATSGNDFEQVLGTVKGSSIPKSSTLDIVSWNVEWFGADRDPENNSILGPSDDALQYQNVKKAIQLLDADIYALQEVANDALMAQLVSELPGYSFIKSDVFSYSIRQSTFKATPQKLYFVYKTSTVAVKKEKVLFKEFYTDLIANTKQVEGYPGSGSVTANDDSFWASGRLPYMVEFEVNINGIKQNIHALNIHARANSGSNTLVVDQRRFDLKVLKDTLDAQYPNVNLVMLGDYNDDVDMSVVGTNQPSTYDIFVNDANYNVLTYPLSLITTEGTYNKSSFLDHITISNKFTPTYISESIQIEERLYTAIPRFLTTTSDHAPVSARFDLSITPAVTFTEATATKAEGDAKYNVNLTLSAAQATEQTVTVSVLPTSTATAADYTITGATDGMVTITVPANATTASFEVEITDDNLVEATEQVIFQITNKSANLAIGSADTYTLTITDNDKSTVNFAAASANVKEGDGEVTINLTLDQAPVTEQTVKVTLGGDAVYTTDYTTEPAASNGMITLTLPAGQATASVKVNLVNDFIVETDKVLTLTLSEPSANLLVGTSNAFTLNIADDDKSTISFASSTATVNENAGEVTVALTLTQATVAEQTVKIEYGLSTGLAYNTDFTTTPAPVLGAINLTIPAGASTASFKVNIVDDAVVELDEVLTLYLREVSSGLVIGSQPAHEITITDNDKSSVNFAAAALKVNEESGLTEVTITLDQATVKAEQITVSVSNGVGVTYGATGDYTTTPAVENGNIVIAVPAGATSVKFGINVIDDQETEEDELISFGLAAVSDKLAIGTLEPVFNFTIERNDLATGIADATKGQFKVYPNPATNYVNLVLPEKAVTGNVNLSVWSVDGRRVFETTGTLENAKQNLNSKVSSFATGVYIIKVQAGKDVYQTRLMKK